VVLEDSADPTIDAKAIDVRLSRNMANSTEKNIPAEWSIQEGALKNIKWVAKLGNRGYMPPAAVGGKVFIATNNSEPRDPKIKGKKAILMCFRESDGQFLWQLVHDMPPPEIAIGAEGNAEDDGLLSTPFVEGERLYYLTPAAVFVCASTDGKVIWTYNMVKELGVFPCYVTMCSPLVVGDLVFAVTGNGTNREGVLSAPKAPSFVAVNKNTGKLAWQSNLPGDGIMEGQWTHPAYAVVNNKPQVIFPGGEGWLYSLEPETGKMIWKFNCNPKKSEYKPDSHGTRNYFLAAPVVHDNKVYIGVGQNPEHGSGGVGHFWCIDLTKIGDISPVGDNFDPKAEVNKNSGLVWHYGGTIEPRPKRGPAEVFGRTISTAAIHDGLVYISELKGILHCLDAKTGQKYWEFDLLSVVWGSPYYVDGKVLLGAESGDMCVIPHGKTPPQKDAIKKLDMERPIKSPAFAANGTLYVVTDGSLTAIAGK
jgi:outer membrane protein assembly factor BamB